MTPSPLSTPPQSPWLKDLFNRLSLKTRLSPEEALQLLLLDNEEDQHALWTFADKVRKERVGDIVYYSSTLYLYPTNICTFNCTFCAFYAKPGDPKGWFYTPEQLIEKLHNIKVPITEVHIVAGCYPSCDLNYYTQLFTKIKESFSHVHVKALTAIEYAYLADLHHMTVEEILRILKHAGLDSLPGGGAEILVDTVRNNLAPRRISSAEFLTIHKTAHRLNIPSNVTMLCYHKERPEDLVTHMIQLRNLQDETQGFKNFILLKFAHNNNTLGKRLAKLKHSHTIPIRSLMAVARLFLDNFNHMKALWNYLGIEEALHLLSSGANDLSSTHMEEKVFQMASSAHPIKMDIEGMATLIKTQGKIPCLTNSQNV
ncbi:CofH family radical SAM protein [Candidatus Chlamydia sanziniae]|uniref:Aminodeoxyfutalosine synthase n=1 Tax=Candidatus Chlamydia sanziniae TaxID=1806891 RepID=A0A1A9HTJ2_9CHLA|nr:CofH family radical SAM protein [Candidatus Chlamydia sanziniae]ANH78309.1 Aminodeoxyfutalosine synthase [Candidatus Chlamydia sanziniae]